MKDEVSRSRFSRREMVLLTILFSATFVVATGIQMGNALFPALSRLLDVPVSTVTLPKSSIFRIVPHPSER